jgi:hypothetical protein
VQQIPAETAFSQRPVDDQRNLVAASIIAPVDFCDPGELVGDENSERAGCRLQGAP